MSAGQSTGLRHFPVKQQGVAGEVPRSHLQYLGHCADRCQGASSSAGSVGPRKLKAMLGEGLRL
jgi:hypothetical protein